MSTRTLGTPVLAGLQFQGDVAVVPTDSTPLSSGPVPAAGIAVVRGENGGNIHLLVADGPVFWLPWTASNGSLTLGQVDVPDGSTAFLIHPEHGANGLAPGTYQLRRQREQREVVALVAD